MKNNSFARFARAFLIFGISLTFSFFLRRELTCFAVVWTTWHMWWQMFNFVFLTPKRWFRFNSRIVRIHFATVMTLNNWKMIAETRSYIFRWRSRCRRHRICVNSLVIHIMKRKRKAAPTTRPVYIRVVQIMFKCPFRKTDTLSVWAYFTLCTENSVLIRAYTFTALFARIFEISFDSWAWLRMSIAT